MQGADRYCFLSWQGLTFRGRAVRGAFPGGVLLRVSIAAPEGHRLLVRVLSELDARALPVDEASLRRPTLDDVFLQLTGHAAAAAPDSGTTEVLTPEKAGVPA